jgi:MFS family permease
VRHLSPFLAGTGYTAFALAMAGTRLRADRLVTRLGPRGTVMLAGGVTILGSVTVAGIDVPWLSITGFAIMGIGLAVIFPTVISVISRREYQPTLAVSATSTVGYFGFLAGPPLIGYLAQASSLPTALLTLTVCGAAVIAASTTLPRRYSQTRRPSAGSTS